MPKIVDHAAREVAIAEAAGLAVGSLRRTFPAQRSLVQFCITLVV